MIIIIIIYNYFRRQIVGIVDRITYIIDIHIYIIDMSSNIITVIIILNYGNHYYNIMVYDIY